MISEVPTEVRNSFVTQQVQMTNKLPQEKKNLKQTALSEIKENKESVY